MLVWARQEPGRTAGGELEYNVLESSQNHPRPTWSMEKLSSMKPVPGAKRLGITALEYYMNISCFNRLEVSL